MQYRLDSQAVSSQANASASSWGSVVADFSGLFNAISCVAKGRITVVDKNIAFVIGVVDADFKIDMGKILNQAKGRLIKRMACRRHAIRGADPIAVVPP